MDKKTQKVLDRISANIPQRLREGIVAHKVDGRVLEDRAKMEWVRDNSRNKRARMVAADLLRKGAFDTNIKETTNPEIARELDLYYETKIKQAVKKGEIKFDQDDPFVRMMRQKMQ